MTLHPTTVLICGMLVTVCYGLFSGNIDKSPTCAALTYCGRGAIQNVLKRFNEMESFTDRRDLIDRISGVPRRCSCHLTCHYFGTCCNDAFNNPYHVPVHRDSGKNCLDIDGGSGARVIDACPFNARNKTQQLLCEDGRLERKIDGGYPMRVAPGTLPYAVSVRTKLTYKNKHCALCMGETDSEVVEWKLHEEPSCKELNRAKCQLLQQLPEVGQHYGPYFLPLEFYKEAPYLFRESEGAKTVCDIDIIDRCPRESGQELSNLCTFSTTRIVQDMLTKKVYNNVYCARCTNVQFLTGCEDLVKTERLKLDKEFPTTEFISPTPSTFSETSSISTSFTASSTSSDFISSSSADIATATTTTGTTSGPDGTTTSSTSTVTRPTTTTHTTNDADGDDALNAGPSHPHGQQIIVDGSSPRGSIGNSVFTHGTKLVVGGDNPRGEVISTGENESGDSRQVIPGTSQTSFPNGTILVPDPDNPRGFAILPPGTNRNMNGESLVGDNSADEGSSGDGSIPHGTRLVVGPENSRGTLQVPDNSGSVGSGEQSVAEEVDSKTEDRPPSTTRHPMHHGVLQRLINAVARN